MLSWTTASFCLLHHHFHIRHRFKSPRPGHYITWTLGKTNFGPICPQHICPSLCPTSIHSSRSLPCARAPKNPPANMSPAPFVSTIFDDSSLGTGYVLGFSSVVLRLDELYEGEDEETRVDSAPWVMITSRGREALDLEKLARVEAIWGSEAS